MYVALFARHVRRRLADKDITVFNRNRIERLIARVNDDITDVYGRHYGVWREQIIDFAKAEAKFTSRALKKFVGARKQSEETGKQFSPINEPAQIICYRVLLSDGSTL